MFEGVLPAIITPFKRNSATDLDVQGLERNILYLLSCGIHGIVPCGSTGESATLSFKEHEKVVSVTIDTVNGKVPVLVDGGFRRGTDFFKALAMRASAVCIGRPYL